MTVLALAGYEDKHYILDDFELGPDLRFYFGVPWGKFFLDEMVLG